MQTFNIRIADVPIQVNCQYDSTKDFFRDYLTEEKEETFVFSNEELHSREQNLLDLEADELGLHRRKFTPYFLERAVLLRQTAEALMNRDMLMLHGSTVAVDGRAYLFTAKTGVGKSTHTRLWQKFFGSRAVMVNDDRTILKKTPQGVMAYGSPWSGKHGLHSNICVPLAGICILERGTQNHIQPISQEEAFPFLYDQTFLPEMLYIFSLDSMVEEMVREIPLWKMACTREPSAAQTAYEAMNQ